MWIAGRRQTGTDTADFPTGEIFRYTLESHVRGQRALKELQEWTVVPELKQVFGVADVTSFGGETTQFQLLSRSREIGPALVFR